MSESAARAMGISGIVPARIEAVHGARIDVRSPSFGRVSARLAVPAPYEPRPGDDVLVAGSEDARYVIGVLRALRAADERGNIAGSAARAAPHDAVPTTVVAPDGSSAAVEEDEAGPVVRVRDASGRLVFEHRAGKSVVHVAHDLEIDAPGDIALSAGGAVRIEAGERAAMRASGPVELASDGSALSLDRERTSLHATILHAEADRADLKAKDANLVAGTLRTVVHRLRERADVVERTADRVIERAREAYREIEELSQTKAGRLRLVADTALTLLGKQTELKAREDVKIKGEKIYLG